jgi:hypothetical protein
VERAYLNNLRGSSGNHKVITQIHDDIHPFEGPELVVDLDNDLEGVANVSVARRFDLDREGSIDDLDNRGEESYLLQERGGGVSDSLELLEW